MLNIDDLTIAQAREIAAMFAGQKFVPAHQIMDNDNRTIADNGMIGRYVIVRCHDAGVHAGVLVAHAGRECVLMGARRLWYWKPAENKSFLSGVAVAGLHKDSKVGAAVVRIHLTEDCEIITCTDAAAASIMEHPEYVQ